MKVILIDGKNALYRFGYAHYGLKDKKGRHTGALYGVLKLLPRLKKKFVGAKFVVVWDGGGDSWRVPLFKEYKAARKVQSTDPEKIEQREAVLSQETRLRQTLRACCLIPQIMVPGVEADDLIAIIAQTCLQKGWKPIVYSSDKDFMQLMVDGVILVRDTHKEKKLAPETEKTVFKHFECALKDVLAVRALAGDKSDGIPNPVPGIGPKTAAKLVAAGVNPANGDTYIFTGSEKLLKHVDKLRPVWSIARRNYLVMSLVRVYTDVRLSDMQRGTIMKDLSTVVQFMNEPWPHSPFTDEEFDEWYLSVIQTFARYDLVEALEDRHALVRIQV